MGDSLLLLALAIAFCFAAWPTGAKYFAVPSSWVGLLIAISLLVMVSLMSARKLMSEIPPFWPAMGVLVLGLVNGWAVWAYTAKTTDPNINTGPMIVTVSVSMAVFGAVLDWALNDRTTPSWQKFAGYACAVAAIYLLKR